MRKLQSSIGIRENKLVWKQGYYFVDTKADKNLKISAILNIVVSNELNAYK